MFRRTTPLSAERWAKRQIWLTIGVIVLAGVLITIAGLILREVSLMFSVGVLFIMATFLLNLFFIRFNVKKFHDHYVASFKKDSTIEIAESVVRVSFFRDIGLVTGVLLVALGLMFTLLPSNSLRQQESFNGVDAPQGYTWVVFEPTHEIPEGRILVLRTGRSTVEYFAWYDYSQGSVGFLVPKEYFNPRNLTVLSMEE